MPGRKKKPFINKKTDNVRVFRLMPSGLNDSGLQDADSRIAEQRQCGIEFEDDYNYLQHIKPRHQYLQDATDGDVKLSDFCQSANDAEVFVIRKPQVFSSLTSREDEELKLPEVKEAFAALDDDQAFDADEDFFNQVQEISSAKDQKSSDAAGEDEDDAKTEDVVESSDEENTDDDDDSDADDLDTDSDGDLQSNRLALRLRSNLSQASDGSVATVTRRTEQLRIIDARFDRRREVQMNEDFEMEEDSEERDEKRHKQEEEMFRQMVEEDEKNRPILMKDFMKKPEDKDRILNRYEYDSDSGDDRMVEIVVEDRDRDMDCESFILSRKSTSSYAPQKIEINSTKPKKNRKQSTGEDCDETSPAQLKPKSLSVHRDRNETAEEKKARKEMVKSHQKERKEEKSLRKQKFGQEKQRLQTERVKTVQPHHGTRIE